MASERNRSSEAFTSRIWNALVEELGPLLSRRVLADIARHLPSAGFANARTAMFRAAGVKIGPRSRIQGSMRLSGHGKFCELLSIGRHTLITGGLHADLGAPIRLGDGVRIGHDVSLLTINHAVGAPDLRAGISFSNSIVIEDGCWIASRCVILPGVTIGRGSIVAAGSVVTRDVPPNVLVAGVPARLVRELPVDAEV